MFLFNFPENVPMSEEMKKGVAGFDQSIVDEWIRDRKSLFIRENIHARHLLILRTYSLMCMCGIFFFFFFFSLLHAWNTQSSEWIFLFQYETNTRTHHHHHSFVILCLGYCRTNYSVSPTGGYFSTDYNMVSRKKTVKYCHLVEKGEDRQIDRISMQRLLLRALDFLLLLRLSMCRNNNNNNNLTKVKAIHRRDRWIIRIRLRSNFHWGKLFDVFFLLLSLVFFSLSLSTWLLSHNKYRESEEDDSALARA